MSNARAGRSRRRMASISAITGLEPKKPQRAAIQQDWFDTDVWSPIVENSMSSDGTDSGTDHDDQNTLPSTSTPVPAAMPLAARRHEEQRPRVFSALGPAALGERATSFAAVSSTPTPPSTALEAAAARRPEGVLPSTSARVVSPRIGTVSTASVVQWSLLRMREERGPFDAPWTAATVGLASDGTLFLVGLGSDGAVAAEGECLATSNEWRVSSEALDFCGFRLRSANEERLDFAVASVAAHRCWMSALRQLGWRGVADLAPAPGGCSVALRSHWACVARHTYARVPLL